MTQPDRPRSLEALKAVTHPFRLRLYEQLIITGPATASILSQRIDAAIGQISYHLHQLSRYGYVQEAPELAKDRRERWWRAVEGTVSWNDADIADDAGLRAAADTIANHMLTEHADRTRAYFAERHEWSADWLAAAWACSPWFRLTPQELQQLTGELTEVLQRWYPTLQQPPEPGDGREHVYLFATAFPSRR